MVGVLIQLFANDPRFSVSNAKDTDTVKNRTFWLEVKDLVQEAKSVIKIPSFQIIVGTGCHWFIPMVSCVILSYVVRAFWLFP